MIIDGELHGPIKIKDSLWIIETEKDTRRLIVELSKGDEATKWEALIKETWWESTREFLQLDKVIEYDYKKLIKESGPGWLKQLALGLVIMLVLWFLTGALLPGPSKHIGKPLMA